MIWKSPKITKSKLPKTNTKTPPLKMKPPKQYSVLDSIDNILVKLGSPTNYELNLIAVGDKIKLDIKVTEPN